MTTVRYDDLSSALDFVSDGAPVEHSAYVSLDTGKIYFTSSELDGLFDDEIPDDLETSDRYLEIPHRNGLDLGRSLALRFVAHELPECYEQVEDFFRRRGAYARFKALLSHHDALERWFAFEAEAVRKTLRTWCAENGLDITET